MHRCQRSALSTISFARQSFAVVAAVILNVGCDTAQIRWRDGDLEWSFLWDDGRVEHVSAAKGHSQIAKGKLLAIRPTDNPDVTEIDVEETHYVWRTSQVVYSGQITFRCRAAKAFCRPIRTSPVSGTRPRNVFWRWPATPDALRLLHRTDPDLPAR
jgi:hypothetical protein